MRELGDDPVADNAEETSRAPRNAACARQSCNAHACQERECHAVAGRRVDVDDEHTAFRGPLGMSKIGLLKAKFDFDETAATAFRSFSPHYLHVVNHRPRSLFYAIPHTMP